MKRFINIFFVLLSIFFVTIPAKSFAAEQCTEASLRAKQVAMLGCEASKCTTAGSTNVATGSKKIYMIGDSLTVGMRDAGQLSQKLTTKGFSVAGIQATNGDFLRDALPKLQNDITTFKSSGNMVDTFIIALGTNPDPVGRFKDLATQTIGAIKTYNPSAKIFWVNAYTKVSNYDDINGIINNLSSPLGYTVIDWKKEAIANISKYPFSPDGVHHTGPGYIAKSDFIISVLGDVSGSSLPKSGAELPSVDITVYSPRNGGDSMEGGYESSKPGLDGKSEVRTLEDFKNGTSTYITLAGNPSFYNRQYIIPEISFKDKSSTLFKLNNVLAVVHDTGGVFKDVPEGRFDIPVGKDYTNEQQYGQPFSGKNNIKMLVSSGTPGTTNPTINSSNNTCQCSIGASGPINMLASNNIPQPHKAVIERAASKFSVNPNFIAALFLTEQGNVWKPFSGPYSTSNKGASGPFQFIPSTWSQYKQDGNGDGVMDVQNWEDAAYAAAKLVSTGTNPNTPVGDLNKPFEPNTLIYFSAAYNWGGGNLQSKTNPNSTLSAAPGETQKYMKNIYILLTSDFTKSGINEYGDPRMPGESKPSSATDTSSSGGTCVSSGSNTSLVSADAVAARSLILASTNMKWGNYGSGSSQKEDVSNCLTSTTLISLATIDKNSGVPILVNAMARDHGGCGSGKSLHNAGRAIDIGYYGSARASLHKPEGDKLFKFLFDNRKVLKIDELIWQWPPDGYKCLKKGNEVDCLGLYGQATMSQHDSHIHVGFLE